MEEMLDVPLTAAQAHKHDHDEHHLSYEDLYGSNADSVEPPSEE